jgi:hypothetical protein
MKTKFLLIIFCFLALSVFAQGKTEKLFEFEEFDCESLKVKTFDFAEGLKKTPESKGYVIIYDGKYRKYKQNSGDFDYVLPRLNEVDTRIQLIKDVFSFLNYPPENIVFIKGGAREELSVEYFIVPRSAEIPKPTPNLDKIKHRKGKAPKISGRFAEC